MTVEYKHKNHERNKKTTNNSSTMQHHQLCTGITFQRRTKVDSCDSLNIDNICTLLDR